MIKWLYKKKWTVSLHVASTFGASAQCKFISIISLITKSGAKMHIAGTVGHTHVFKQVNLSRHSPLCRHLGMWLMCLENTRIKEET